MARKRRRRSPVARDTEIARTAERDAAIAPETTSALPSAPAFEPSDANGDAARAALAEAEQLAAADNNEQDNETEQTPRESGTQAQTADPVTTAAAPPKSSRNGPVQPDDSAVRKPERPVRARTLSAKRYDGLRLDQLKGALAIAEDKNEQLEAQLRETAPAAQAANDDALKFACGVSIGVVFDVVAIATGVDEMRLEEPKQRKLGDAWAVALAPYLAKYAASAPIVAAVGLTADIAAEKYFKYKELQARRVPGVPLKLDRASSDER